MATRRTQRKRKVSERVRVVGAAELAAARARRLDALEADADAGAGDGGDADADDDEYVLSDSDGGGGGRRKKKPAKKARRASARSTVRAAGARKPAGVERWNKPLAAVLDAEGPGGPAEAPGGYWAIAAAPSARPPRQLCSVCGFRGPYTCTRCAVRFCSIKCGTVHEETRCLKFTL